MIPKSLTFCSSVTHCILESSSSMKLAMSFRVFLEVVGTFWADGQPMKIYAKDTTASGSTHVVSSCEGTVRPANLSRCILEALEGLGRCDLVDKMAVCTMSVLFRDVLLRQVR